MSATQVIRPPTEPIARASVADVDASALAVVRAYVLAANEHQESRLRLDAARAALDAVAGANAALTYAGAEVLKFDVQLKRSVDVDRLAARWPEAYADVVTETTSYRLNISAYVRQVFRMRTWRAVLARRGNGG